MTEQTMLKIYIVKFMFDTRMIFVQDLTVIVLMRWKIFNKHRPERGKEDTLTEKSTRLSYMWSSLRDKSIFNYPLIEFNNLTLLTIFISNPVNDQWANKEMTLLPKIGRSVHD